jgi:lipopolysaccharide/colanic/teichoic acid biosynthesis glycosyltransferase
MRVRTPNLNGPGLALKRSFDVAVAATVLVVIAPVMGLIALAVRWEGPGVIFRQPRVGRNGQVFDVLKFRTVSTDHDGDTTWSADSTADRTRVGTFLRRTSLDELPQLWNVLRGDMSLVGPRPERPFFAHRFGTDIPGYHDRHRLPVGLTGWAQVNGLRGDTSIPQRARFDNYYVERWSLWFDVVILLRTLPAVLRDMLDRKR